MNEVVGGTVAWAFLKVSCYELYVLNARERTNLRLLFINKLIR